MVFSRKGTVAVLGSFLVMLTVASLIGVNRIYVELCSVISYQNRADAHMLSVIGLYADTLDKVSWINAQLQRIGLMCAAMTFVPQLAPLVAMVEKVAGGLQAYQDMLLLKLVAYAPVLDNRLRVQNGLAVPGNIHYFRYRRRPPMSLVFVTIPGLIEINSSIFRTACVKHSGVITDTMACVTNEVHGEKLQPGAVSIPGVSSEKWFVPTEEKWGMGVSNAN